MISIRKSRENDIDAVTAIYEAILGEEEAGRGSTGWQRGVYPTQQTAGEAHRKGELFVMEEEGKVVAAARINQEQVPEYADCPWKYDAPDEEIMVLHTLVVDPGQGGKGLATKFVAFYQDYALKNGCRFLRMDTNENNTAARGLYNKLGFFEPGFVSCIFNGIAGVRLVCLEKRL